MESFTISQLHERHGSFECGTLPDNIFGYFVSVYQKRFLHFSYYNFPHITWNTINIKLKGYTNFIKLFLFVEFFFNFVGICVSTDSLRVNTKGFFSNENISLIFED